LSALVIYLMVTKTPKPGQAFTRYLILLQLSIISVDLNFGILYSPIGLYPVPGGLCNGILCTLFGFSGHAGTMLMFFTIPYVGACLIYCVHYKYITILAMINHRPVSATNAFLFRIAVFTIFTIPAILHSQLYRSIDGGPAFVKQNFPTLSYLFEDPKYRAFAYDLTLQPHLTIALVSTTLFVS
ncbi:hypothetical protein PFISCL1PPCAC_12995, partial [Pristionchus fissidentatus]